jgi:hypothetical protein
MKTEKKRERGKNKEIYLDKDFTWFTKINSEQFIDHM